MQMEQMRNLKGVLRTSEMNPPISAFRGNSVTSVYQIYYPSILLNFTFALEFPFFFFRKFLIVYLATDFMSIRTKSFL
jgi:hypothetical protein